MKKRLFHCALVVLSGVVLTLALFWLFAATPVQANPGTRYIAATGSDTGNDCTNPGSPCATIQHAIDVADPADEIHVADGTYNPGGTVAAITKELTIIGSYAPDFSGPDPDLYQTVLDAGWAGSVVSITNAGDVVLESLTLTHGDGSGNCGSSGCGGGVYANGTNLHVIGCVITNNVASKSGDDMGMGGGIYAYTDPNGFVEIQSSRIVSNTANANPTPTYYSYGGGVFVRYATALLQENEILDNVGSTAGTRGMGGGVYLYGVTQADVLSNTIQGNKAATCNSGGNGGGLYIFGFKAHVAGNYIGNNWTNPNWAGYGGGGGVYVSNQTEAHLTRNTIISNATAPQSSGFAAPGGGVFIASSDPVTLSNNLIARNTASLYGGGGGVYVDHGPPAGLALLVNNTIVSNTNGGVEVYRYADLELINNVIAGHTVGVTNTQPASSTITADHNLFWNTSDPITGTNGIREDPLLTSDYHLGTGSLAIDAGLTISWLTTDLSGNPRPQGGGYDIGAFEVQVVYLPLVLRNFP